MWATNCYKNEYFTLLCNEAILMSEFYDFVKYKIHRLNYYIGMANNKNKKEDHFNDKDLFYEFFFCVQRKRQLLALFTLHELQLRPSTRTIFTTFEN